MQTIQDGEYVAAKELDTSFKIPKRKNVDEDPTPQDAQNPVMENSYYNFAPEPVPLQPTQEPSVDPAQNLVLQILKAKSECEKPKTYANHILKETIPDYYDESLPKDLTVLFQPLYCKLCSAQLSSNVVARLHYKSKNHEKKIRKFLIDYSEKMGEPLHKRAKLMPKDQEGDDANPMYYHCDICDLPLTGKLHAESHYMGKNHRKATLGLKNPAGKGHLDAEGKWIRNTVRLPEGDDGFGRDFRPEVKPPTPSFVCDICNVTTTCREQLESHYNGQKHQKKLKRINVGVPVAAAVTVAVDASPHDNILSSILGGEGLKGDCSVYRTPSGQYYCPTCNTSMNSETQFKQHLQSKNHLKKAAAKK